MERARGIREGGIMGERGMRSYVTEGILSGAFFPVRDGKTVRATTSGIQTIACA
jgi:hypothetical protein